MRHIRSYKGQLFAALFCLFSLPLYAQTVPDSRKEIQLSFAPVAKQAAPAVANIYADRTVIQQSPFAGDPLFQRFFGDQFGLFGMPRERVEHSLGSGVLVSRDGKLITNYHVIENAENITAVLADRREYKATILVRDEAADLALLQLEKVQGVLPFLRTSDSDMLEVGDLVLAIGNPFGVGQTVTSGIISATARSAATVKDAGFFLQTDAAINPGNSGGALVNMRGELIGVPTAIYSRSGGSNGIGFAIPANRVRVLLQNKGHNGKVQRPWLGARFQNIDSKLAQSLGLKRISGVLIAEVYPNTPAEDAGLQSGDVIIRAGDKETDDAAALQYRVEIARINTMLPLTVIRQGRERTVDVEITLPAEEPARNPALLNGGHPLRGAEVANLNPALAAELQLDPSLRGVVVTNEVGQLKPGDIVESVNGTAITSTTQLQDILSKPSTGWGITFKRGDKTFGMRMVR